MSVPSVLLRSHGSRAASLPTELPRASLDGCALCTAGARTRRGSIEVARSARAEHALALSVLSRQEGVVLEVGKACDFEEQRKRLEKSFWEPGTSYADEASEDEGSEGELSAGELSADPRTELEQRWQSQGRQTAAETPFRTRRGRRRTYSSVVRLSSLRSTSRHRARSVGRIRAQPRSAETEAPLSSSAASQDASQELSDQSYLAELRDDLDQRRNKGQTVAPLLGSIFEGWGDTGLLSREAEVELGKIVQKGLQLQTRLDEEEEARGHSLSPEEQEAALGLPADVIQMRLANRFQATQLLIQYNMRLLANVARRFEGRGVELEDLIVEGTQGLERAIVRFDPSKGYKFSTYAYMWIRQSISRCISENARIVRLPSHVYEIVGKIRKTRAAMEKAHPDKPVTDAQLGAALGLSAEKVAFYLQAGKNPHSLEDTWQPNTHRDTEPQPLEEVLEDTHTSYADEVLVQEEQRRMMKEDIDSVLSGLSLRERNVLRYRYGLHTDAVSLADLSAAYGLTKERIRKIGEIALAKLQMRQASKGKSSLTGQARNVPVLKPELYGYH